MGNNLKVCVLAVLLLLFLVGCSKQAPVYEEGVVEEPLVEEEEIVEVEEPEEEVVDVPEEAVVSDEKQLSTGGATHIKEEEPSILSNVICDYGIDGPEMFSFRMTNIEDKKWRFSSLSYDDRESADNPIVVLNALQVTNGQMIYACGGKTVNPGSTVTCDFNLEARENILVMKNLRTGDTPMGNVNENVLSLRTAEHAAEVVFLCE
jgi:hypothetical protein